MSFAVTLIFQRCLTKQDAVESVNSSLLEEYIRKKERVFLGSIGLGNLTSRNEDVGMISSPVSKVCTRNALDPLLATKHEKTATTLRLSPPMVTQQKLCVYILPLNRPNQNDTLVQI